MQRTPRTQDVSTFEAGKLRQLGQGKSVSLTISSICSSSELPTQLSRLVVRKDQTLETKKQD